MGLLGTLPPDCRAPGGLSFPKYGALGGISLPEFMGLLGDSPSLSIVLMGDFAYLSTVLLGDYPYLSTGLLGLLRDLLLLRKKACGPSPPKQAPGRLPFPEHRSSGGFSLSDYRVPRGLSFPRIKGLFGDIPILRG